MSNDLEARINRLEDRAAISEAVIKYAVSVDQRDWALFEDCFTDPVYIDYSELGGAVGDVARADVVATVSQALDDFTATQHLSPNHVIEFDETDPDDRAVCHSYMYAQHLLEGSAGGEFYLLRGSYDNHMIRTPQGWRIERLIQHVSWQEGNTTASHRAGSARVSCESQLFGVVRPY